MREALGVGDDVGQLARLAGLGQRQDHVVRADHAEVAVAGLGGMDEEGRRAGGGEGGGDLARHVAGLAHAGADDPALRRRTGCRPPRRRRRPGRRPGPQRLGLGGQHPAADGDGVEFAHCGWRERLGLQVADRVARLVDAPLGGPVSRFMAACMAGVRCTGV